MNTQSIKRWLSIGVTACLTFAAVFTALARNQVARRSSDSFNASFTRGLTSMHDDAPISPLESRPPPAASGSATAIKWAENPINTKVGIAGWVIAESNTTVTIILGNVTNTITGIGTNDATNVIPFFVQARTMEPVAVRVEGDMVQQVYFEIIPPTRTDFSAGGRNRGKQPKGYRIYFGDEEKMWISDAPVDAPGPFTKEWKVTVRAELKSGPGGTVEDIAEHVAPGDAGWPQIGPGKSPDATVGGIKWEVPVGRLRNGKSASNIRIGENGLTADIYTPWALLYEPPVTNRYEVNPVYDTNGLRQVLSIQGLVDIVTNSATSYELRFYPRDAVTFATNTYGVNDSRHYDLTTNASPYVVWRISNPDAGGASNRLRFEEVRGTNTWTSLITYNSTNTTWRLEYGSGSDLRIEERRIAFVDYPIADRLETNVVMNASNQVAFICVERYHPYEWDWELVSTVTDPAGAALTTTYSFHDNNLPSQGYGQLKHTIYPDGFWERRNYHGGSLRHLMNPWHNEPAHPDDATIHNTKFTDYHYQTLGSRTLLAYSCEHVKVPSNAYTYSYFTAYTYSGNTTDSVVIYRETIPWPWEHGLVEGELHINGCYGVQYAYDDAKAVYKREAGELLNGLPYAALTGWQGVVSFAHHQGNLAGTNFTVFSGDNWSEEWTDFPMQWRSIQVFSIYYGVGDAITSIDGQAIERYSALSAFTTNVITFLHQGCKVRDQVWVYFSPSNTNGPTNSVLLSDLRYDRDAAGRLLAVVSLDPTSGQATTNYSCQWEGALKIGETDGTGATTLTAYDLLKRPVVTTKLGWSGLIGVPDQPDTVTAISLNAASLPLAQMVSAAGVNLLTSSSYDLSKRMVEQTTPAGTVSLSYYESGRRIEASYDNGTLARTNKYLDRKPQAYEGTGVVPQYFNYDTMRFSIPGHVSDRSYTVQRAATTNAPRFFTAIFDSCGRPSGTNYTSHDTVHGVRTYVPYDLWYGGDRPLGVTAPESGSAVTSYVGSRMTVRQQTSDYSHYAFSSGYYGGHFYHGPDFLDATNAPASPSGGTRGTLTEYYYHVGNDGGLFRLTTNSVFLGNIYTTTPTVTQIISERLTGFTDTLVAEATTSDLFGPTNTVRTYHDRDLQMSTEIAQSSLSTNLAVRVSVGGLLMSESTFSQPIPTTYTYDAFGRQTSVTTPAGITLYTTYEPQLGLKLTQTDFSGRTNFFEYYPTNHLNAQQLKSQIDGSGKKTYFAYNARNQLVQSWGDVPYPEQRVYNDYGEMVELHTFRGGTNWQASSWPTNNGGTPDITRWTYQEATGLLFEKVDAKSNKWVYTYDGLNRLARTTWSRLDGTNALTKENIVNKHGEVVGVNYSSGAFVTLTNLNALGLPTTIIDDSGEHTLAYDPVGRLTSDAFSGVTHNYIYNQFGRASLSVTVGTNTVTHTNAYDSATGRLLTMEANGITATYSYLTNADLVAGITFKHGSTNVLTTAKTFEHSSRLKSITNALAGGSNVSSHLYAYDAIHRRTNATLADGSYWRYGYDDRTQLTSAKRYWSGGGAVAGQQYEYSYDSIGNRTVTQSGGSQFGTSLRQTTWTVNELNQTIANAAYGYLNIFGEADASATVTVNHESVYRNGEFFRKELLLSNSTGPLYPSITNTAVINNYGTNGEDIVDKVIGNVWVPKNPETLTYDEDGNLTQDSRWVYRWDAENRLKEMETRSGLPTNVPLQKLTFTYDHQGRRASKAVYAWSQTITNYHLSTLTRFIYDGWNLLAELDVPQGTNAPVLTKSFLWGLDLSGTPDQAGGIGGLLAISQHSTPQLSTHLPCFDGNGNVMAMVHAGSGQPSARYEYAPFGEPLRVTGEAALLNPFRFSTKYTDDETGLLYYGYRYYSPTVAKWLNRDPLGEEGGLNLYAFVANNPITGIDALGLSLLIINPGLDQDARAQEARTGASFTSRVKDAVEGFNDFQDLASIAMDLFDGVAGDDMLLDMLQRGQQNLAGGLKKGEGHHSIPKFLGGESAQNLIGLAPSVHDDFHRDLHSRLKGDGLLGGLGGKKNGGDAWDKLLKGSSREQKASIFKHLLKSSLDIDSKHGGNGALTMSVLGNFLGGRGGHFRLP